MDGIQGAILDVKLRHLEAWTEARRSHAAAYARRFEDAVTVPRAREGARHVYHVYAVRTPRRDAVRERLTAAGVQTGIHYPIPLHLQPAYRDLGYKAGDFPVSEELAATVLSLPMYPEMTAREIDTIVDEVRIGLAASVPA
jgi:dTDP-4-amino-4,6-dideoxygalactose transaminase